MNIPTSEQVDEFIQHLWNVHSWYKHIPLIEGMRFYVFLNSDAGENYPLRHPELKYGNNKSGYQKQFGELDYVYTLDGESFYRDGGTIPSQREVESISLKSEFVLFPYVHSEIYWSVHEDALDEIVNGRVHPHRENLSKIRRLELESIRLGEELSDDEYDYCLDVVEGDIEYDQSREISSDAYRFIRNKISQRESWLFLQKLERLKVTQNVHALIAEHKLASS